MKEPHLVLWFLLSFVDSVFAFVSPRVRLSACPLVRLSACPPVRILSAATPWPAPNPWPLTPSAGTPFALRLANGKCHFNYVHSTKILCGQSTWPPLCFFFFLFSLSISICALSAFAQCHGGVFWGLEYMGYGIWGVAIIKHQSDAIEAVFINAFSLFSGTTT